MKRLTRACVALGVTAGLLFLMAPPSSAGGAESLEVVVAGTASCLPSGGASITWLATVEPTGSPDTSVVDELNAPLGVTQAVVQFDGEQSGAATGPVTFDPFQQTVPASNDSFPVDSQAVAAAPGDTGGTVVLDVTVLIFNPANPEQDNFTLFGQGEVDLPICEQPVVTEATTATSPAAETRPRFTG
jgi:hypothetical protein